MIKLLSILLTGVIWLASQPALAALNVFACEPEWGALSQEIGGDSRQELDLTGVHGELEIPSLGRLRPPAHESFGIA